MNEPGDSTLATAADNSPAGSPLQPLSLTIVREGGDWSAFTDADAIIADAAAALARHPRCWRAQGADVTVVLGNDTLLRSLNATYRHQDKPTNVLSFPFLAPPGAGPHKLLGDVVLAAETIAREAAVNGVSRTEHLQHLVIHGLLHLLGFEHDTDAEAEEMEALEIAVLAELGVANPYAPAEGE